ncbi:MAG: alpha/beta hydrolase fold protein [Solirubrobacterales bacterium]|nr:alpha/beta hydrolase fold protein [Solirubrobacterales bacterium]
MEAYRGGTGTPLVLLHGFTGTWRVWRPVLHPLTARHAVFAPTLPGHHGAGALEAGFPGTVAGMADVLEAQLDAEGIERAHLVGNSLGGWLALELGRRGRARSVVALSPAGGWGSPRDLKRLVRLMRAGRLATERGGAALRPLVRRPGFRRLLLRSVAEHGDRVPASDVYELLDEALGCVVFDAFLTWVSADEGLAAAPRADYPIRIAWSERDRTLPLKRYGRPLVANVPGAELVILPGVGHVPMFDDAPLVARTILDVTSPVDPDEGAAPMSPIVPTEITGTQGRLAVHHWRGDDSPGFVVVLAHGYGEHAGRYAHVAERLIAEGASVFAPDHAGHGRSDGTRALIQDVAPLVDDLSLVVDLAAAVHPELPIVLVGHSMGGVLATRLAQRDPSAFAALVLSGPVIGGNPDIQGLLALDPLPDVPIDPAILSRDASVGAAYMADPLVYHGPFHRATLEAIFGACDAIAAGPTFGDLPTVWVHGEEDALAPLSVTREAIEHVKGTVLTEHVYPGARHEVLNETNRDEVLQDIVTFLREQLAVAAR